MYVGDCALYPLLLMASSIPLQWGGCNFVAPGAIRQGKFKLWPLDSQT